MGWAIAVHGGAGPWDKGDHAEAMEGVKAALKAGTSKLSRGAAALDAAIAAVVVLEDSPVFNSGTGSALNLRGEVECDASVMEGHTLRAGAVAAVRGVKNAVRLADYVRSHTDHVLLSGKGAEDLARFAGLRTGNKPTAARLAHWKLAQKKLLANGKGKAPGSMPRLLSLLQKHPELASTRRGTVGAVAVDAHGHCAVATSTGGVMLKLPGRIGDTPIIGAGSYADAYGAASATGLGELVMRTLTTRVACERLGGGVSAQAAAQEALDRTRKAAGTGDLGLIVVDRTGRTGAAHGTEWMPHGFAAENAIPIARMAAGG